MHKKFLFNIAVVVALAVSTSLGAYAFSTANYATTSKLASGKWVKVAVPENGIYQITFEELAQMEPRVRKLLGEGVPSLFVKKIFAQFIGSLI